MSKPSTSGLVVWPLRSWTAGWRVVIASRIEALKVAMDRAGQNADLKAVEGGITQARSAAGLDGHKRLSALDSLGEWWTGSAIESTWRGLHRAEQEFVLAADDDWILARLNETQDTLRALGIIGTAPASVQVDKPKAKAKLQELNADSDRYHSNLRDLRNILFTATALLMVGLAVMALVGALAPHTFSLCGVPKPASCDGPTVLEVEIAGGFGGLLSAVVFLSNLPTQSTPYTIWFFQGLLKAPTGAALALIVVFLVQTGLVGFLKPDTAYVIPYALVFGFAQQAATRVVDKWATGIVAANTSGKSKDNKK